MMLRRTGSTVMTHVSRERPISERERSSWPARGSKGRGFSRVTRMKAEEE
jgi:hypothetical protein